MDFAEKEGLLVVYQVYQRRKFIKAGDLARPSHGLVVGLTKAFLKEKKQVTKFFCVVFPL